MTGLNAGTGLDLTGTISLVGLPGHPVALGGMADVYQGNRTLRNGQIEYLALKVLRVPQMVDQTMAQTNTRRLERELTIWIRLRHPNVLPFYGTCRNLIPGRVALVSPWMANGSVKDYIRLNPNASRQDLVDGIISGVAYLHSHNVVHGDIKGNNVLIDGTGRAVLTDFGRAFIIDEIEASKSLSAAAHWTAPEVLMAEESIPLTKFSDVWSLAVTILEVYVGMDRLWGGTKRLANVVVKIQAGRSPAVGGRAAYNEVPAYLWDILEACWRFTPGQRPAAHAIQNEYRNRINAP